MPTLTQTRFWFLRHGETDWNAKGLSQGNVDIPLNGNGIAGSVDGLTGQLAQDAARRVHRTLEWARIDDGVPKPLEP